MVLIIQNQLSISRSYLSGVITLAGNTSLTAALNQIFLLSRDSALLYDCMNNNVFLSDGTNIYMREDAVNYLNQIAASLGSQVIGYLGTTAPNFAILVGSRDASGNIQSATIDSGGGIIVAGEGTAGTPTGGIVTVQGQAGMTPLYVDSYSRIPEVRNRTVIVKNIVNTTGLIYTVTGGKTFYLTSIGVSAINTSGTVAQLAIQDNTTTMIPFLWQAVPALGSPQPFAITSTFENNPVPFSTSVKATQVAGTLSCSVYIIGYEE